MEHYICAKNRAQGLAVWCWRGGKVTPEDWTRHLNDMESVRDWTELPYRPCVLIYSIDSEFSPNASQRAQIARISASPSYRPNLAVVSNSPLVRGAMRALSWMQGPRPYRIAPFADLNGAISWLEKDRRQKLPALFPLLEEAHQRLDHSLEAVIRAREEMADKPIPPASPLGNQIKADQPTQSSSNASLYLKTTRHPAPADASDSPSYL